VNCVQTCAGIPPLQEPRHVVIKWLRRLSTQRLVQSLYRRGSIVFLSNRAPVGRALGLRDLILAAYVEDQEVAEVADA
jgi:hypothetical protein